MSERRQHGAHVVLRYLSRSTYLVLLVMRHDTATTNGLSYYTGAYCLDRCLNVANEDALPLVGQQEVKKTAVGHGTYGMVEDQSLLLAGSSSIP